MTSLGIGLPFIATNAMAVLLILLRLIKIMPLLPHLLPDDRKIISWMIARPDLRISEIRQGILLMKMSEAQSTMTVT